MTTSRMLMPHAVCWAADPRLIWTMVVANFVTFLSYVTICGALLFISSRTKRVIARDWGWFVVGFAFFIVACGSTHLMDVITTWIPAFWIGAWAVIITALLSAYVAVMLIRRATHIGFAINDYTQRLANAEHEKDNMRDRLLAARKIEDWSKMSAVISHEISNPLEAVQNLLYLMETQAEASPEVIRLAEQARQEVGRVITISSNTLSFHRESAAPERVDLLKVAESVVILLQGIIRQKNIDFRILGDHVSQVEAFPGETRQVMLNLARNACEATRFGSAVTLAVANVGDGVELQVTDQGPGVDPTVLPNLFEFGKTTKGEKGNGIGLWTVKQILLKHGGRILLDQHHQGGSRFIAYWPLRYRPRASSGPTASQQVFATAEGR